MTLYLPSASFLWILGGLCVPPFCHSYALASVASEPVSTPAFDPTSKTPLTQKGGKNPANPSETENVSHLTEPQQPSHSQESSSEESDDIYDPLEDWNRSVFTFNQMLNVMVWDPLSLAYENLVPDFMQKSVRSLLSHISLPISLLNDIFQFDGNKFSTHFVRLLVNTSFGLGGTVDIAGMLGVSMEREDFGKTLKNVGVGPGLFVILPILGPCNTRDSIGRIVDAGVQWPIGYTTSLLLPQYSVEYLSNYLDYRDSMSHVHQSFSDPYLIVRNLYYQLRGDIDSESFSKDLDSDEDGLEDTDGNTENDPLKKKTSPSESSTENKNGQKSLWDGLDFPDTSAQDDETVLSLAQDTKEEGTEVVPASVEKKDTDL